MLLIGTETGF